MRACIGVKLHLKAAAACLFDVQPVQDNISQCPVGHTRTLSKQHAGYGSSWRELRLKVEESDERTVQRWFGTFTRFLHRDYLVIAQPLHRTTLMSQKFSESRSWHSLNSKTGRLSVVIDRQTDRQTNRQKERERERERDRSISPKSSASIMKNRLLKNCSCW